MRAFERRALTAGEIALGQGIFGAAVRWPRVRVAQAPWGPFGAMVPLGETIWFGAWRAPNDFSLATRAAQGWLIHELAHVWQAARGVVLPVAKLGALTRAAYAVRHAPEKRFKDHNIEAQAEIARLLFLAREGVDTVPGRDVLETLWAEAFHQRFPAERRESRDPGQI